MNTKQVYISEDGRQFDTEERCKWHEQYWRRAKSIEAQLNPVPDSNEFMNGHGFVQQDLNIVTRIKIELLQLAREAHPECTSLGPFKETRDADVHPGSIVGRVLDDYYSPIVYSWSRLAKIDDKGREWGQQYFANNPEKGEHVQIA